MAGWGCDAMSAQSVLGSREGGSCPSVKGKRAVSLWPFLGSGGLESVGKPLSGMAQLGLGSFTRCDLAGHSAHLHIGWVREEALEAQAWRVETRPSFQPPWPPAPGSILAWRGCKPRTHLLCPGSPAGYVVGPWGVWCPRAVLPSTALQPGC